MKRQMVTTTIFLKGILLLCSLYLHRLHLEGLHRHHLYHPSSSCQMVEGWSLTSAQCPQGSNLWKGKKSGLVKKTMCSTIHGTSDIILTLWEENCHQKSTRIKLAKTGKFRCGIKSLLSRNLKTEFCMALIANVMVLFGLISKTSWEPGRQQCKLSIPCTGWTRPRTSTTWHPVK